MKISDKSWKTTVILFHVLGVFGAHRFYVGKAGTGLLYIAASFLAWVSSSSSGILGRVLFGKSPDWITYYLLGIVVLMDLIKIYSGNFTDENGALVLPPYKQMLLQTIWCAQGPAAPAAETPAASAAASRDLRTAFPESDGSGVIKMNHISPDNLAQINAIRKYYAVGLHFDEDKIDELVLYDVSSGKILRSYLYTADNSKAQDFADFIGPRATLVCYGLRAGFRAFGALLKDVQATAEWDYLDLQELAPRDGVQFEQAPTALDRARNAIAYLSAYQQPAG